MSDEDTKAIYVGTPYMQMLLGHTGIARIGTEPTNRILLRLLQEHALPRAYGEAGRMIHELGAALDKYFKSGPGRDYRRRDRRLTIGATGFAIGGVGPHQALLTNFQVWGDHDDPEAWDQFRPTLFAPDSDNGATVVQKLGQWRDVDQPQMEEVRSLLAPSRPASAARNKMAETIAVRAGKNPSVGAQLNTAVLPRGGVFPRHIATRPAPSAGTGISCALS